MTVHKKLYAGYASVVGMLVLIFIVNTAAVLREGSAHAQATAAPMLPLCQDQYSADFWQ